MQINRTHKKNTTELKPKRKIEPEFTPSSKVHVGIAPMDPILATMPDAQQVWRTSTDSWCRGSRATQRCVLNPLKLHGKSWQGGILGIHGWQMLASWHYGDQSTTITSINGFFIFPKYTILFHTGSSAIVPAAHASFMSEPSHPIFPRFCHRPSHPPNSVSKSVMSKSTMYNCVSMYRYCMHHYLNGCGNRTSIISH